MTIARSVGFDLFSTLVPGLDSPCLNPDMWEKDVSDALGVRRPGFASAFSASGPEREVGAIDFREALKRAAQILGAAPTEEQIEAGWRVCVNSVSRSLAILRPGMLRTLETLRYRGCRIILCSNASADAASAFRGTRLPTYFDDLVFSCEVGVTKPHLEIYARVGNSGYFVGDGGSQELEGAQEAGLQAIQVPAYRGPSAPLEFRPAWNGTRASNLDDLLLIIP